MIGDSIKLICLHSIIKNRLRFSTNKSVYRAAKIMQVTHKYLDFGLCYYKT